MRAIPASALAGEFTVTIYAQRGQSLDDLVKIADAEIERLKKEGPTLEEITKAQNTQESQLVVGLQSAGRKADFLNNYNVEFGDPLAYKAEMVRLFKVTPEDVKRVANQYLTANRIRLDVNPGDPTPRKAEAEVDRSKQTPVEAPKIAEVKDEFDRSKMPEVGPTPKYTPPVTRRTLSNGLEVLIAERHELPILTLNLVVKGGEASFPSGKEGARLDDRQPPDRGTADAELLLELAGALSNIGASIDASGKLESTTLSLTTLTKHTERGLEALHRRALEPVVPREGAESAPRPAPGHAQGPARQCRRDLRGRVPRLLYGLEHPYGRPDLGTVKTVNSLKREDVVAFHKALFLPNNASLIVVGDTTPDAITASLEKAIKDWKPVRLPSMICPRLPSSKKPLTLFSGGQAGRRAVDPGCGSGWPAAEHARLLPADPR